MSVLLFANDATSTLAGAISNTATTASLASGTGVLFPNPGAGEYFTLTFVDEATGLLKEIVWVTARSGDVVTIVRAQEGTTALNWLAGSIAANFWTAGQAATMLQQGQSQSQETNYAVDTGTVNHILCALDPPLTEHVIGMPIRVSIAHTNTGLMFINPGPGEVGVVLGDGGGCAGGECVISLISEFVFQGTYYQLINPAQGSEILRPIFNITPGAWSNGIPIGVTKAKVTWGAGGGGGAGGSNSQAGGGGGGGCVAVAYLTGLVGGTNLSGAIGDAGAGGATGGHNGVTGGNTTLLVDGVLVGTANGGVGGFFGSSPAGGSGGSYSAGTFVNQYTYSLQGSAGGDGLASGNTFGGNGAPGWQGAGAGRAGVGTGTPATSYGAGGGGSYGIAAGPGGNGFAGFVLIEWEAN